MWVVKLWTSYIISQKTFAAMTHAYKLISIWLMWWKEIAAKYPSNCSQSAVNWRLVLPVTSSEMLPIRASLRTFTAKKKRTPNLERRPSIMHYPIGAASRVDSSYQYPWLAACLRCYLAGRSIVVVVRLLAAFKVQLDQVPGVVSVYGRDQRTSLCIQEGPLLPIDMSYCSFLCIDRGASPCIRRGSNFSFY